MEVGVKTNGVGSYTVLTPLQALTPTPYAMFANTASNVLGVVPAAQLSGTVAEAHIDAAVARNSGVMPIVLANGGATRIVMWPQPAGRRAAMTTQANRVVAGR